MNIRREMDKIAAKLRVVQTDLDELLKMDNPPRNKVEDVRKSHLAVSEELEDLERIFKNRIWQRFGLDYYLELERQVAEEEY